ncbi:MAG: hypothetical protein FWB74_05855 [Defluviitaleaceae bacterium]|nr:hypothetical protein [Defluviitaleaceae bacterium]
MKKIFAITFALGLLMILTGCDRSGDTPAQRAFQAYSAVFEHLNLLRYPYADGAFDITVSHEGTLTFGDEVWRNHYSGRVVQRLEGGVLEGFSLISGGDNESSYNTERSFTLRGIGTEEHQGSERFEIDTTDIRQVNNEILALSGVTYRVPFVQLAESSFTDTRISSDGSGEMIDFSLNMPLDHEVVEGFRRVHGNTWGFVAIDNAGVVRSLAIIWNYTIEYNGVQIAEFSGATEVAISAVGSAVVMP